MAYIPPIYLRRMPLLHHVSRRFLDALNRLNPAQIEDAQTKIRDLRWKTEVISEIEARTHQKHNRPFCARTGISLPKTAPSDTKHIDG